jgi:uncharacterized protein YkwD
MLWRRFFLTFPLLAACSGAQPVHKRHPGYSDRDLSRLERKLLEAVNERRKQAKLLPLVWSDLLASEARRHSIAMLEGGFFAHRDPVRGDLDRRIKESEAKLLWRRLAENIHQQRGMEDPVSAAVESWMKSAGHRKNILDGSFNSSGVGIAVAQDGTHYITQIFALLLPAEEDSR